MTSPYDDFEKAQANFVPLTPLSFLSRAAKIFKDDEAIVYGQRRYSWGEFEKRCRAIASQLAQRGLGKNSTVSVIAPNIPEMFELHFAIPMSGAVINTINTRLEADTIAYILEHGESQLVFCDAQIAPLLKQAFDIMGRSIPVIDIAGDGFGECTYEEMIANGDTEFAYVYPEDEWQAIALNYTSGTSGRPKGVVYHHRGAYLMAMGTLVGWSVPHRPTFLSVSPMFHCNGWTHPWAMTMKGAKTVFTRDPDPKRLHEAIISEGVTHFGGAPIVLSMLVESPSAPKTPYQPAIKVMTAGAPPPPAILEKSAKMGFEVMQVYGLTETYGHISQCLWRDEWAELSQEEQAAQQAKQGVAFPMLEDCAVLDRETLAPVPQDGETQGEIAIRGNVVMKGYFKAKDATNESFAGGYFWSGDAAVVDAKGYIQIRDRLKDVIISGGENISSVEVEAALFKHPAVLNAAVVAMPSEKWGESPCAFVELRDGHSASESEIIDFARSQLAGFKVPKAVVFEELPKTSTGKIQKFELRERAKNLGK